MDGTVGEMGQGAREKEKNGALLETAVEGGGGGLDKDRKSNKGSKGMEENSQRKNGACETVGMEPRSQLGRRPSSKSDKRSSRIDA